MSLDSTFGSKNGKKTGLLGIFSVGPGVGAAILAKASCPFCYPAIAGFLSSVGLGFLFEGNYFLILMGVFFLIALFGLIFKAKSRHGLRPFFLGIIAVLVSIAGHLSENEWLFYVGVGVLVIASVWNLAPVNRKNCDRCVS